MAYSWVHETEHYTIVTLRTLVGLFTHFKYSSVLSLKSRGVLILRANGKSVKVLKGVWGSKDWVGLERGSDLHFEVER